MMSQLIFPNIVRLYGITTTPQLRIVMEFCPLPDLRLHLSSQELLPDSIYTPQLKLCFCLDIAKALEFMHSLKPPVVHRDLRSPNVKKKNNNNNNKKKK